MNGYNLICESLSEARVFKSLPKFPSKRSYKKALEFLKNSKWKLRNHKDMEIARKIISKYTRRKAIQKTIGKAAGYATLAGTGATAGLALDKRRKNKNENQ